ncbi:chromate efflux transporter [Salinicoccus halitifaciens]|uniref:Chromate transporter n=1 Tax=Salinicoccus halitifaciens TaxID=1073415 RepID=A0ABV2EA34_9STAP|nr:chromate efflux transporter [Salinicoccus halitifaciens]MCD2138378.1 chromate efflux transporter [Salinicoccus halitifaciens]
MSNESQSRVNRNRGQGNLLEILLTSLRLGLTSFGGPVAHLAYFKDEYVNKKKWLDDKLYADIIAVCQFLPGPASSQVGISIGMLRGGIPGGILSFLGFTVPSVIVLIIFALMYQTFDLEGAVFINSLKIVAVAVVLHALIGMGQNLAPDIPRMLIAIGAAGLMLIYPNAWIQILTIAIGGVAGYILFRDKAENKLTDFKFNLTRNIGIISFVTLIGLLILLPILNSLFDNEYLNIFDIFFRVGSIVFGGGHVVLPMIEREVVPTGLVTADQFLAGYGMAQAVPGPLFTFASYLGTVMLGTTGGIIATIAMFLPSFLLVMSALPFLNVLRGNKKFQSVLMGVNAAVVGILLAAFYNPVFTSGINSGADFFLALLLFFMLFKMKMPAWMIVILGVVVGYLLQLLPGI